MTPSHTLTIVAPLKEHSFATTKTILDQIAADAAENPLCPFGKMATVHFARWVLLKPAVTPDTNEHIPAELIFTTVYDRTLDAHLEELLQHGRAAIDALYSECVGYPAPEGRTDAAREAYLRGHALATGVFYGAHDGLSLRQILLENRLVQFLREVVDARRTDWIARKASNAEIQQELVDATRKAGAFAEAPTYAADVSTWPIQRIINLGAVALAACVALAIWPVTLALFAAWLIVLRYHEMRDATAASVRSPDHLAQLAMDENLFAQSQITVMSWVKPGWFRLFNLRLVFLSATLVSRVLLWPKRVFFGLESIHYAQWVILDGGKRMVFFSNFDGSWESYIGEFVDKAHFALTPIWTNCIGFPKTSFLFFGGAAREGIFKELVRDNQVPTDVWYSAYPNLTVPNVNDAADINSGLHNARRGPLSPAWPSLI